MYMILLILYLLVRPLTSYHVKVKASMHQQAEEAILRRIDRVSVKDLALDRLKKYIFSNAVTSGQRLPSERELAERLGIGRPSVREALKVLEAIGLVESRIGEGTFVTHQSGASIGRHIGVTLASWGSTVAEICRARQIIETECARAATEHATPSEIQALAHTLQQIEMASTSAAYLAADMQFHRQISYATHNAIVTHIIENLITLLEETLQEGHADQLSFSEEGLFTHRSIFTMIANRDSDGAAAAMRQHLQFSTELWQAIVSLGAQSPANDRDQNEQ